jgi:integrase
MGDDSKRCGASCTVSTRSASCHEHVATNLVLHVETRSKSSYRAIIITPAQTVAILKSLPSPLHYTLVLTCAATALRSSETLALRWADVHWHEGRIQISKRWAKGEEWVTGWRSG